MQSEKKSIASGTHGITIACVLLAIVTLPLLGVTLAGGAIHHYLEFPPFTRSVTHEPFSWAIFIGGALLVAAMFVPFLARVVRTMRYGSRAPTDRFPWWGWIAIGWTLLAWSLAWSRLGWMDSIQGLTFTPLWLGFIVMVNALTFRRIGHCMMLHRPRYFLSLFPLSALFWWSFEYLNRFVQNWYYLGGQELTAWEYLWQATLSFSTVLPAVLGTAEWLSTYRRQVGGLDPGTVGGIADRVAWGWGLLCAAAACLLGLGLWPDFLFFLVWVAPLLLITALQWIRHEPTIWDDTRHEGWGVLWTVAFAALTLWLLLGAVEFLQPGPLGICRAVRAPVSSVPYASVGLCRLSAVRVGMSGRRGPVPDQKVFRRCGLLSRGRRWHRLGATETDGGGTLI